MPRGDCRDGWGAEIVGLLLLLLLLLLMMMMVAGERGPRLGYSVADLVRFYAYWRHAAGWAVKVTSSWSLSRAMFSEAAALVVASGLGLGIALVIVVNSVSSGMNRAQDKVLESLYGLGTDMTVTKAAAPPGEGDTARRPRFEFDANDSDDDSEQSSAMVMVEGFETLASSTVAQVGKQDGVADAVGGLSVRVMTITERAVGAA